MNILNPVSGLVGILGLWYCLPYLLKRWQIIQLRKQCRESRSIVLTYDDGPGKVLTPALLEVLASNGVRANFFMVGHKIESLPNQARKVVANGHTVGSHTFKHLHAWKCNPFRINRDILSGFQACAQISASNWFRPPFGKITLASLLQTRITRHRFAWWTVDSTDTWTRPLPVASIVERVKSAGGGVVLMHDCDRADVTLNDYVIDLTLAMIQLARDEGYDIRMLQDLPSN